MFMKRRLKLGKEIKLIGGSRYFVFYDSRSLSEVYCFLFDNGDYHITTEWNETINDTYMPDESLPEILSKHNFVLV